MVSATQRKLHNLDKIDAARTAWEAETILEEIEFAQFEGHRREIRRHKLIKGGMATLHFGYDLIDGQLREVPNTIYFGMITSDVPGDGGKLLSRIKELVDCYALYIVGQPTPLKPMNWGSDRHFSWKPEVLENWYLKHGFQIEKSGSTHRVSYPPKM